MEKKVLDYLGNGKLQLRKCQTLGITGGSHSSASRQVLPQSAVKSRILSKQKLKEVMTSSTRQKNNFSMKESEILTVLWTC